MTVELGERRPRVEWSNIVAGLALAAAGWVGSKFMDSGDALTALQARADSISPQRNRELDDMKGRIGSLEAELHALERDRCR